MTLLAMLFMIISVGFVTGLAIYCYYRVLLNGKPDSSISDTKAKRQ